MNTVTVLFPILSALVAPEGTYFKYNNMWNSANPTQEYFLNTIYNKHQELSLFNSDELQSWVSESHQELNDIAKERGFSIQFDPFKPNEIGALSILDVNIKWLREGQDYSIFQKDNSYKAVELKDGLTVFSSDKYHHPIARIETLHGDVVYMTIADEEPAKDQFALYKKVSRLKQCVSQATYEKYDRIRFPHVKFNQEIDISWLGDMWCKAINDIDRWLISQAKQQVKFAMDKKGAHIESAVAIGMECTSAGNEPLPKILTLDKPFYIWIERKGTTMPYFMGYINEKHWVKQIN